MRPALAPLPSKPHPDLIEGMGTPWRLRWDHGGVRRDARLIPSAPDQRPAMAFLIPSRLPDETPGSPFDDRARTLVTMTAGFSSAWPMLRYLGSLLAGWAPLEKRDYTFPSGTNAAEHAAFRALAHMARPWGSCDQSPGPWTWEGPRLIDDLGLEVGHFVWMNTSNLVESGECHPVMHLALPFVPQVAGSLAAVVHGSPDRMDDLAKVLADLHDHLLGVKPTGLAPA